jgi:hypothetical protein
MSLKISIPKPCHENWAAMSPDDKGRFCSLCAKTVVDFTAMPQPDVEGYLLANADKKVCGRFSKTQLNDAPVTVFIPREVLFRQTGFRNIFLLALAFCMGSTLFSCKDHNDRDAFITGEPAYVMPDSLVKADTAHSIKTTADKPVKPDICKSGNPQLKPGIIVGAVAVKIPEPPDNRAFVTGDIAVMPDTAYVEKDVYSPSEVHIMPEFPGGITKLYEYINSNLKAPENVEGGIRKMYVSFIIEKDGSLGTVKVLRGFDESLNAQVIGILKKSPKWIPAQLREKNVRVQYSLPITIKHKE